MSLFRQHMPTMEQELKKTQKNVKKANKKKRKRKETPEIFERWENNENRWSKCSTNPYVLLSRSLVPRLVERCLANRGINLKSSNNEDYLVVKSNFSTTFTVNREEKTKSGPQVRNVCLKEYAYLKYNTHYDQFPLILIIIDQNPEIIPWGTNRFDKL